MDKLIEELEKLTQSGLTDLQSMSYEELSEFMDRRTLIINALLKIAPSSLEKQIYKKRINAILTHDVAFLAKLNVFKEQAREQLMKIGTGRTHRNAYDYADNGESFFFDRKK